jgi:hypothetical protein
MASTKAISAEALVPGDRIKDRGKDVRVTSLSRTKQKGVTKIYFTTSDGER